MIYHWEDFGSIWGTSSSGGSNPWYPSSSTSRTSTSRAVLVASGLGLNPSFAVEHSSSITAFGRLDLYLREHFVCSSSIALKPSIQICFSIVSGAFFLIIKFSYLLVVPILCSVDDLHMMAMMFM